MWVAIAVFAFIHLATIQKAPSYLNTVTKPVPILLFAAVISLQPELSTYSIWVVIALLFSAIGDAFLAHPKDKFIPGLFAFLLAHIGYIVAFYYQIQGPFTLWLAALLICVGILSYLLLLPGLDEMELPVAIYCLVIATMLWFAFEAYTGSDSLSAKLAVSAACVFVVSDFILAWNRFRTPFKYGHQLVMSTYYSAQLLFTLSVLHAV